MTIGIVCVAPHGGFDRWDKMGDDDIDAKPDELFRILLGTIALPIGVAELDPDVLAFRVAKGVQTAPESISERMRGRSRHQHADEGQFSRSLCPRRKRPDSRRATKQRDELTPPHVFPSGRRLKPTIPPERLCITANSRCQCPLWVKSRHSPRKLCDQARKDAARTDEEAWRGKGAPNAVTRASRARHGR